MPINQKGAAHILLPLLAVITISILGVTASSKITTTTKFSSSQVLGENESAKKAVEQAKEASQKAAEQKKESDQKISEQNKEAVKINAQSEGKKSETEIETKDGLKIKTKVEDDGTTKVEIEQKRTENKETEQEDEASGSADEKDLQELRSISNFPLRIDLTTNQLIMTKNGVERVLTVLPAKAVQNMLRAHLKKDREPKFFEGATPSVSPAEKPIATKSAEITVLDQQVTLEETDGQIAYKIPAKKHLKLFGFIPATTDFTSFVSAENGVLIKNQESLLSKVLDFLSP